MSERDNWDRLIERIEELEEERRAHQRHHNTEANRGGSN
jgi:uncharacterized protein (UPF0335 family)